MFQSFGDEKVSMKMRKPSKNKSFLARWEGPYLFASYKDRKRGWEQDEDASICIIKDKDD
jgi:hypothetical protein